MRKAVSILLVVAMLAVIATPIGASNKNLQTDSVDYERFIQKHEILYNELVAYLVIGEDGTLSFQNVNARQIAAKAELPADIVETYVDGMRFALKQANEQGLTLDEKHVFIPKGDSNIRSSQACGFPDCNRGYWCCRTKTVVSFPETTESYFCSFNVSKMLHNINKGAWVWTGISLLFFQYKVVSFVVGLVALAQWAVYADISSANQSSGYNGVLLWKLEGPHYTSHEWNPWY